MLRIEIERSEFMLSAGLYVQLYSAISHVCPKLCSEISSTLEVIVSPNLVVRRGPSSSFISTAWATVGAACGMHSVAFYTFR